MSIELAYDLEDSDAKLSSASIVGDVTPDSARIWIRTYATGVWWLVVTAERIEDAQRPLVEGEVAEHLERLGVQPVFAEPWDFANATDRTHTFLVEGLEPGRRYHYTLYADASLAAEGIGRRREIGFREDCSFRTPEVDPSSVCFGLYSCHDPFEKRQVRLGLWRELGEVLDETGADFCIGAGDQVYVDSTTDDVWVWLRKHKRDLVERHVRPDQTVDEAALLDEMVGLFRYFYRRSWALPDIRRVFRRYPQYMIWDDHEIMDGWGSLTKKERSQRLDRLLEWEDVEFNERLSQLMFTAATRVYREYQHGHNPETAEGQYDYEFERGAFAFYVLDMRGDHDIERTQPRHRRLLGEPQHRRFRSWVRRKHADGAQVLFVVAPVPVVHWRSFAVNRLDLGTFKDDFRDEWDHETNQKERDDFLEPLLEYSQETGCPVVILSGDVHCGGIFRIHDSSRPSATLWQVTSSPISRSPVPDLLRHLTRRDGVLSGSKTLFFDRKALWTENNFGLVRAELDDQQQLHVRADLYAGESDDDEAGVLSRRRVELYSDVEA